MAFEEITLSPEEMATGGTYYKWDAIGQTFQGVFLKVEKVSKTFDGKTTERNSYHFRHRNTATKEIEVVQLEGPTLLDKALQKMVADPRGLKPGHVVRAIYTGDIPSTKPGFSDTKNFKVSIDREAAAAAAAAKKPAPPPPPPPAADPFDDIPF